MLRIARVQHPQGRARPIHDPQPNVEKVFWRGSGFKKVPLAEALWPVLERKVTSAIRRRTPGPPLMQACFRAYEMMAVSEQMPVVLGRRKQIIGKLTNPYTKLNMFST